MAAKLSKGLGEQVTCPICLQHYSDPRLLPCLHTYCRHCLQALLTKGQSKVSVVCPECREEVQIVSGDVTKLKVNFWINNLLSLLAIHSTEKQDGGKAKLTCENCDSKATAKGRCVNCCMFLCEFCSTAHKRFLATKDHQLMTLDEMKNTGIPVIEKLLYCTKHKGEVQKLFCNTCQELICRDCTIIDHRNHQFNFLEDIADQHKQLFKKEVQKATSIKNKIQAVLKSVQKMKEKVGKTSKATQKDVDVFIDEQIKALEGKRNTLKQDVQKLSATKMKELAAQEDGLVMQLTGLKSAIEFTEKVLTNGGNSDVLSVSKQLTTRLTKLSNKFFPEYPCQEDKMCLESDKELFRDFILASKIVDDVKVDHNKCSVAQRLQGGILGRTLRDCENVTQWTPHDYGRNAEYLNRGQGTDTVTAQRGRFHTHTKSALVQNPNSVIHATQGEALEFVVQIKNSFGKNLKSMADRIEAFSSGRGMNESLLPIKSLPDDTYSFTVQYGGRCNIEVLVDGKNISGSPINIHKQAQPRYYGAYQSYQHSNYPPDVCCPDDPCYQAQQKHW